MGYQNLIFFALLVGVFWFVIVRPQQQRQKQHRDMLEMLAPGDEIVTIGGLYGTVVDVGERVRIAVADGSELEVARAAVAQITTAASETEADEDAATEPEPLDAGESLDADA